MNTKIINIRALAAILVVLLHCSSQEFYTFDDEWWFYAAVSSASRPCVPLFLMISGYLLLNKEYDFFHFMRKRFLRILPPLYFWGVFYVAFVSIFGGGYFDLTSIIMVIYNPPMFHLWYLYVIVGLYIFVPILSRWNVSAPINEKGFYVLAWVIILFLSQSVIGNTIIQQYYLGLFGTYLFFFIAGAYLKDVGAIIDKIPSVIWFSMYIISTSIILFFTIKETASSGIPSEKYFIYTHPFVVVQSLFLFCFLHAFSKTNSFILSLSECSLGIYCIHVAVILILYPYIKTIIGNGYVLFFISAIMTIAVSWFITILMKRVRFLNYFL